MAKRILVTTTISILFQIYLSKIIAQYDNPIPVIRYNHTDTIEEKNLMNLTRDIVFCIMLDTKIDSIYDSNKLYLKKGKVWASYNSENDIVEKGKFKRYKSVRRFICLLVRPKYWSKVKRKIEHNGKDYFPMVKAGKWAYLDSNGKLVKTLTFNKFGENVTKN